MLEQGVPYMTEAQIDDYYRDQREENLKRYYTIRANRELRESRGRLIRLVIAMVLTVLVCTVFLQMSFCVQQQTYRIAVLQKELNVLRQSNDDAQKRLEDAVTMQDVQQKAQQLGMEYPKAGNVVYYSVGDEDYMFQIRDIPAMN
mgnify:FL=1